MIAMEPMTAIESICASVSPNGVCPFSQSMMPSQSNVSSALFSRCSAVVFNKLFCFGMRALATDGSWYASDGESFYCCSKLNLQMLGKDDAL
jgi:hypothetical protein